jgi:hypothetical protein
MSIGRNDPCPCGSGRKFKRCCLEKVNQGVPVLPPEARELAREVPVWEMDLVPAPLVRGRRRDAGVVVAMVQADELTLLADTRDTPGAEAEDIAKELERALSTASEVVGRQPSAVVVGYPEIAESLAQRLEPRGVTVLAGPLTGLAAAAYELLTHLLPDAGWPPSGVRESWAGWGKDEGDVADLHRAAAAYYRAAPWRSVSGDRPIVADLPGDRSWVLAVMGSQSDEYGLAMYSDMGDYAKLYDLELDDLWGDQTGRVYGLTFCDRNELPRRMQREVAGSGWEIASVDAYPALLALRSPAGGICRSDWCDLVTLLDTVPRFLDSVETGSGEPLGWQDPETGISFALLPEIGGIPEPPELHPGCAEGPGAEVIATPAWHTWEESPKRPEMVDRFADWLAATGVRPSTVDKHRRNVEDFLRFLEDTQGITAHSVHELDLREFLYDWVHRRSGAGSTRIEAVPASLSRFFAFLESEEQLSLPIAEELLGERELFRIRARSCPHQPFWTQATREWMAPLTMDLYSRVLLPDDGLGEDDEWGDTMGDIEWQLRSELGRRWLGWRDELIREGITGPPAVREELVRRQRAWERESQEALGGLTPIQAILGERDEIGELPDLWSP